MAIELAESVFIGAVETLQQIGAQLIRQPTGTAPGQTRDLEQPALASHGARIGIGKQAQIQEAGQAPVELGVGGHRREQPDPVRSQVVVQHGQQPGLFLRRRRYRLGPAPSVLEQTRQGYSEDRQCQVRRGGWLAAQLQGEGPNAGTVELGDDEADLSQGDLSTLGRAPGDQ